MPYLVYTDALHTDVVFAFICELLTRATRHGIADDLVSDAKRLKTDMIAGTKQ